MKAPGPRRPPGRMSRDGAEDLAIAALGFLAADEGRLERFLALSGLAPDSLRRAAAAPGFLPAVLDHLASDETLVTAFAAAQGCDPAAVGAACAALMPHEPDAP